MEALSEAGMVSLKVVRDSIQAIALNRRDLLPFDKGDNDTDVIINGKHYNLTILQEYNWAVYSNGTMSNHSWCYLTVPEVSNFMPDLFPNSTIVNGTSCYIPWYPIGDRGKIACAFFAMFAISIMFTLVCLRKHGQLFLQASKKFRAIGRRWQWYWALFIAACAMVSCFAAVDVDRYYLPSAPSVINVFFWYLMIPGVLACVWESVRHWGSWQERQLYDIDPFMYKNHDRRSQFEFYSPLVFYLFAWLNFFMNIPRNWIGFQQQADQAQIDNDFIPTTHDIRFKVGAILAFCAWLVIPIHLLHSLYYYKFNARSQTLAHMRPMPRVFYFTIPLPLVMIGYAEASAWIPSINMGNEQVTAGWVYGLGFTPALLVIILNIVHGLRNPNEDLELMRQRVVRGRETDAMLGIDRRSNKPKWWRQVGNDFGFDNDAKLRALANTNVGFNRCRDDDEIAQNVRMQELARSHIDDEGISPASPPPYAGFRDSPTTREPESMREGLLDVTSPPVRSTIQRDNSYAPSFGSETTATSTTRPQQIRSMLDI